jgi:hypothetical protein
MGTVPTYVIRPVTVTPPFDGFPSATFEAGPAPTPGPVPSMVHANTAAMTPPFVGLIRTLAILFTFL